MRVWLFDRTRNVPRKSGPWRKHALPLRLEELEERFQPSSTPFPLQGTPSDGVV